jgi:hypothetical protein
VFWKRAWYPSDASRSFGVVVDLDLPVEERIPRRSEPDVLADAPLGVERVDGQARDAEPLERGDGPEQRIVRLVLESIDRIDVDVADEREGGLELLDRTVHGVVAVHRGEEPLVEGLNAIAQAIHAQALQQRDLVPGKGIGRGLDGDFSVPLEIEVVADRVEEPHQLRVVEGGGPSPADIDRLTP